MGGASAPSIAADAVLKESDPVPNGMVEVNGIDFNKYDDCDIPVHELVSAMGNMGFQASAVSEASRIINDMVRMSCYCRRSALTWCRSHGVIQKQETRLLFSWATRLTWSPLV